MRHRVSGKTLARSTTHRKALFKNLVRGLIDHGHVKTTEAKAKAIKRLTDKLISRAKKNTVHSRRILGSFLNSRHSVNKLVDEIAPKFTDRHSGFTRIVRIGPRRGDATMMASLEFVGTDSTLSIKPKAKAKKASAKKTRPTATAPSAGPQAKATTTAQKVKATTQRTTHK